MARRPFTEVPTAARLPFAPALEEMLMACGAAPSSVGAGAAATDASASPASTDAARGVCSAYCTTLRSSCNVFAGSGGGMEGGGRAAGAVAAASA